MVNAPVRKDRVVARPLTIQLSHSLPTRGQPHRAYKHNPGSNPGFPAIHLVEPCLIGLVSSHGHGSETPRKEESEAFTSARRVVESDRPNLCGKPVDREIVD